MKYSTPLRKSQEEHGLPLSFERMIEARWWERAADVLEKGDIIPGFLFSSDDADFVRAYMPDNLELEEEANGDLVGDWHVKETASWNDKLKSALPSSY